MGTCRQDDLIILLYFFSVLLSLYLSIMLHESQVSHRQNQKRGFGLVIWLNL